MSEFIPKNQKRWSLASALDIQRGDVIALVGGGGKTSAMFHLAGELAAAGWRVITTTTTHIGREQSAMAPCHIVLDDNHGELEAAMDRYRHVLVTGPLTENNLKWGGVPSNWDGRNIADVVLVEADGAKHLPFKAPADYEPVIPLATTLLLLVVGVDAVGGRVRDIAHRPEKVCKITGLDMDDRLTPTDIAAVLAHPEGGLKDCPPSARVCVLINKADTEKEVLTARQIMRVLLDKCSSGRESCVSRVVIGAVASKNPVRQVHRPTAAIVLAAGRSLRMKGELPKQLLPWRGRTIIRQVVETLSGFPFDLILVVAGHRSEKVAAAISGARAQIVLNPDYETGEMLSSAKAGIRALSDRIGGCLIVLGDQPWLEPNVVEELLNAYARSSCGLAAPTYQGQRGNPVLVDRRYWPELLALKDGLAPRHVLEAHFGDICFVPVETDTILRDLDTWDDYCTALQNG